MKRSMIVNLAFIKFVKGFARFPFRCVFHSLQQSRFAVLHLQLPLSRLNKQHFYALIS